MATSYIEINSELCKDCKLCVSVCPQKLIQPTDQLNQRGYRPVCFMEKAAKKDERKCSGCALCAIACPEIAIEVYRG